MDIIITYDGYDYRVPAPDGKEDGAYYTDDRQDAWDTVVNFMYKDSKYVIVPKFISVDEHPIVDKERQNEIDFIDATNDYK